MKSLLDLVGTGKWFGLERWGVRPDIVSFAKIVTSGYLPLGGIIISDELHNTMLNAPIDKKYMHAYTYSGHATCCAVGLKNIEIIEKENLVEQHGVLGARLLTDSRRWKTFRASARSVGLA